MSIGSLGGANPYGYASQYGGAMGFNGPGTPFDLSQRYEEFNSAQHNGAQKGQIIGGFSGVAIGAGLTGLAHKALANGGKAKGPLGLLMIGGGVLGGIIGMISGNYAGKYQSGSKAASKLYNPSGGEE